MCIYIYAYIHTCTCIQSQYAYLAGETKYHGVARTKRNVKQHKTRSWPDIVSVTDNVATSAMVHGHQMTAGIGHISYHSSLVGSQTNINSECNQNNNIEK